MEELIIKELNKQNWILAEGLQFLDFIMDKIIEVENINNRESN